MIGSFHGHSQAKMVRALLVIRHAVFGGSDILTITLRTQLLTMELERLYVVAVSLPWGQDGQDNAPWNLFQVSILSS